MVLFSYPSIRNCDYYPNLLGSLHSLGHVGTTIVGSFSCLRDGQLVGYLRRYASSFVGRLQVLRGYETFSITRGLQRQASRVSVRGVG